MGKCHVNFQLYSMVVEVDIARSGTNMNKHTFCVLLNDILSPCSFFVWDRSMLVMTAASDWDIFGSFLCLSKTWSKPSAWWNNSVISLVFISISRSCCASSVSKFAISRFVRRALSSFTNVCAWKEQESKKVANYHSIRYCFKMRSLGSQ